MQQRATVVGVKKFKGDVEGNFYDNCKVRVMMPVPGDSETEAGFNVVDMKYGKSENFDAIARMQFPFEAEIFLDLQVKNGRTEMALVKIQPVQQKQG